jgi:hypothetical protein
VSKLSAFKEIGQTILPDEYALDADAVGKRVKLKYEEYVLPTFFFDVC